MPKFSVKRPMTVFVVVMIIIALGIVSLPGMTPDLMPSIDLPYVVVMTTYPGATPEEIEEQVTRPLEEGLAIAKDKIEKLNTRLLDQAGSSLAGAKTQINSDLVVE